MSNRSHSPSSGTSSCSNRESKRRRRWRDANSSGACSNPLRRLNLMIALSVMACCCCYSDVKPFGPVMVTAFRASPPPRTSSKKRFENSGLKSQQMDATPLKEALELIAMETSGSRRVTKKALLESIGYGVMDPLAYQTFENSPLPPKLRPTTHVRIADGIHTFGQEFLGVPPEEGVSPFSEYAAAGSSASETAAHGSGDATDPSAVGRSQQFELQPKLPGLGMRMTMLRLGSGELLAHSPVAPTVELLDMLRDCFPAVGPTTKVHLFSTSVSPEHWAFLKHWKAIFPAAEVWAVPGPHRRLMGVEVDHDIEQVSGVPERLGEEVEVAVLEGVPMVREALLLHRPTGTVLSADLLLAMDPSAIAAQDAAAGGEGQRPEPTSSATAFSPPGESPTTSSSLRPKRFGEHSGSLTEVETSPDSEKKGGGSRWRRLRWGILDKTASLLDMNTLAVFAPVKTLLHAFKGNSGAFSSRVLSWDTKVLVACHGQSPLEGPELKGMLHAALGRYIEPTKDTTEKKKKKKLGTRLLAFVPGRRGGENSGNPDEGVSGPGGHLPGETYIQEGGGISSDGDGGGGGGSGGGGDPFSSVAVVPRQPAEPGRSSPAVTAVVAEPPEQQAADAPSAGGAGMPGKDKAAGGVSPWSRRLPTTSGANGADNVLGGLRVSAGEGEGETMLEAEARARRYVRDKLAGDGAGAAEFVAPPESPKAARGRAFGGERKPAPSASTGEGLGPGQTTPPAKVERQQPAAAAGDVRDKGEAGGAGAEGGDNPFVVGPDTRYDEAPVGPIGEADDDPFEAPFYPFDADGPPLNGRAFQ